MNEWSVGSLEEDTTASATKSSLFLSLSCWIYGDRIIPSTATHNKCGGLCSRAVSESTSATHLWGENCNEAGWRTGVLTRGFWDFRRIVSIVLHLPAFCSFNTNLQLVWKLAHGTKRGLNRQPASLSRTDRQTDLGRDKKGTCLSPECEVSAFD